ncbi:MAG: hypothetical protein LBT97_08920 [Planctomycetota bacterium]|nr:hypothetical protein [Planctomycetota bacterium]
MGVRGPDGETRERCAILVGADGAQGVVRRLLGESPRPECRYLAIQESFETGDSTPDGNEYLAFFHSAITDFYGWAIPKRGKTLLGVLLPPKHRLKKPVPMLWDDLRSALERCGRTFPADGHRQACIALRPTPRDVLLGRDGAFCIGETAGFISPSSAEGYSYAFSSASALAESMLAHSGFERIFRAYKLGTAGLRLNLLLKNWKSGVMYSPTLRNLVMRSGILSEGAE